MIKSVDNHIISFIEKGQGKRVVLLCHGITSSKDEGGFYIDLERKINAIGYATFRFDFRGHGSSNIASNKATISGMICDLHTVYSYLETRYTSVIILASSFGASILLLLSQKRVLPNLKAVILLNPVLNFQQTFTAVKSDWAKSFFPKGGVKGVLNTPKIRIGEKFSLNPLMALEMFYYSPLQTKLHFKIPILLVHGLKDKIVSYKNSEEFAKKRDFVTLMLLPKSSHGLEEDKNKVFRKVCDFIRDKMK